MQVDHPQEGKLETRYSAEDSGGNSIRKARLDAKVEAITVGSTALRDGGLDAPSPHVILIVVEGKFTGGGTDTGEIGVGAAA